MLLLSIGVGYVVASVLVLALAMKFSTFEDKNNEHLDGGDLLFYQLAMFRDNPTLSRLETIFRQSEVIFRLEKLIHSNLEDR